MITEFAPVEDGNHDIGYQLEVGALITFLFASAAVVLRTIARTKYSKVAWDDGLMLFALVRSKFRQFERRTAI